MTRTKKKEIKTKIKVRPSKLSTKKITKKSQGAKKKVTYQHLIDQHLKILKNLEYKSGLFAASSKKVGTGYDKAWLRDNFYECLAFEVINDWDNVLKTYRTILDIFEKHEYKINYAIMQKPEAAYQYIHPRYHPESFDEFWEEWGNKQHDSIGAILFKIGELEGKKKRSIIRGARDIRIVQKLIYYLESIEYWHDKDNGMWEEDEEVHASSVGACVAGLMMIKKKTNLVVPQRLIDEGKKTLKHLLPRESKKKYVDLALLSLIWPYKVVKGKQRKIILNNVEYHLERKKGVIRYKNDAYYNKNPDGYSEEAEWTFGLSWLSIIYDMIGNKNKAKEYLEKAIGTVNKKGQVPELYFSNTNKYNENSPLGWSESLFVVALYEINKRHADL